MNESCPTVNIKADNEQGFITINESDFDEKIHTKVSESEAKAGVKTAAKTAKTPETGSVK